MLVQDNTKATPMQLFLYLFVLLLLPVVAQGQILILPKGQYTKVDVQIDEYVPVYDYLPWSGFDDHGTIIHSEDPVHVLEKFTAFFLYDEKGVIRILTRKRPKSFIPAKVNKQKTYTVKSFLTSDLKASVKNLDNMYTSYGCISQSYILYNNHYAVIQNCFIPVITAANWAAADSIYSIFAVNYYEYRNVKSDIKNNSFSKTLIPKYIILQNFYGKTREEQTEDYNKENGYYTYGYPWKIDGIYWDIIKLDTYNNDAFFENYEIPFLSNQELKIQTQEQPQSENRELKEYFRFKPLTEDNCTYGYTIYNPKMEKEKLGYTVVPKKFFLPLRLKINSVDDVPWEEFMTQVCAE